MTSQIALEMQIAFFLLLALLSVISVDPTHLYKCVCPGVFDPCKFSSSMLRIMTSLCVSFVRMCSKPLFEDYCYVNEDRLYNTE